MNILPFGCEPHCRACGHRNFSQIESETKKFEILLKDLDPWKDKLESVKGPEEAMRWHYRERVCLRAEVRDRSWIFGLLQDEEVLAIPNCPLHSDFVNHVLECLKKLIPVEWPLVFVVISGKIATLVFKSKKMAFSKEVVEKIVTNINFLKIESLYFNWNLGAGQRVFSSKNFELVWGKEWLETSDGLFYGPDSFQQISNSLYKQALLRASDFLAPHEQLSVLDFYSGNGASCLFWQKKRAQFKGIELGGRAIMAAQKYFGSNSFLRGRVSDRLPQIEVLCQNKNWVIFANPPRTGLELKVVEWINGTSFQRMAYLSCSARTLARDIAALNNWRVVSLIPYDFFPQTRHCEVLAMIENVSVL